MEKFSLVLYLSSSSFNRVSIWLCIDGKGVPHDSWASLRVGRYRLGGKMASFP